MNEKKGAGVAENVVTPIWATKRFFLVLCGLTVAALIAAGWFGSAWLSSNSASAETSRVRTEAEQAGEKAIAVFGTLDHRAVDAGLDSWQEVSTGPLNDEVKKSRQQQSQVIKSGKTSTGAKILDAGLTELDVSGGTAKMIAVAEIVVTPDGGQPVAKRNRFLAELQRTEQGWKLSSLRVLAIGG